MIPPLPPCTRDSAWASAELHMILETLLLVPSTTVQVSVSSLRGIPVFLPLGTWFMSPALFYMGTCTRRTHPLSLHCRSVCTSSNFLSLLCLCSSFFSFSTSSSVLSSSPFSQQRLSFHCGPVQSLQFSSVGTSSQLWSQM